MKIFVIKGNKNIYYKRLDDIELNNNIHDRFLVYRYLKKELKSKIEDFYLFYDDKKILNCFIVPKTFDADEFSRVGINTDFLREQIKNYFLYKKSKIAAQTFHEKQKYSWGLPYIFHLNKVDSVIDHYFYSIPGDKIFILKSVAMLHDIIEDTSFSVRDLRRDFGNEIADTVLALTKRGIENIKIFEWLYFRKVVRNDLAMYVKFADKIVNGKQTLKDKKLKNIRNMLINHEKFKNIVYSKFNNNDIKEHLSSIIDKIKMIQ